jgi:Mrp family chromosome partitioning ATPase
VQSFPCMNVRSETLAAAILRGPEAGRVFTPTQGTLRVGRDTTNEIVLSDPSVDSTHLRIAVLPNGVRLSTPREGLEVVVEPSWEHRASGRRGVIVYLGATEILLTPGPLTEVTAAALVQDRIEQQTRAYAKEPTARLLRITTEPLFVRNPGPPEDQVTILAPIEVPRASASSDGYIRIAPRTLSNRHSTPTAPAAPVVVDSPARTAVPKPMPQKPMDSGEAATIMSPREKLRSFGEPTSSQWEKARERSKGVAARPALDRNPRLARFPGDSDSSRPPNEPLKDAEAHVEGSRKLALTHGRRGHPVSIKHLMSQAMDPALAVLQSPEESFGTAIRVFGTVIGGFIRERGYRAFLVTSPEPQTGKTTVAMNLCLALSEDTQRRVALVEANFRSPRLAEIAGLPPSVGIRSVLNQTTELGNSVVKVEDRNLIFLPSGGKHDRPAELVASPQFKALLSDLIETVDVAIIDAPAVLAGADVSLLQPLVDGSIMVVLEGLTASRRFDNAVGQIDNRRLLGTVYNRVEGSQLHTLRRAQRTKTA